MFSSLSKWIFRMWGCNKEFKEWPLPLKCVYAVVPHTSWWDLIVAILFRKSFNLDINFVGKKSLFKPPLGFFIKWLGGYPVDRSKRNNFVDAVVDIFNESEKFALALAPEGTRRRVDELKTGFYHIAKGAGVPIILSKLNWREKTIAFSAPFYPTEDQEADFIFINKYFEGALGKNPELSYRYQATK